MTVGPTTGSPVDRRRRLFVLCGNGDIWVVPFPDLDAAGRECAVRPISDRFDEDFVDFDELLLGWGREGARSVPWESSVYPLWRPNQ